MSDIITPKKRRAERLEPDNFTAPARTPWGGRRILDTHKPQLGRSGVVGESWEISVSELPSRLVSGELLQDAIEAEPTTWLGVGAAQAWGSTPLLVKLLDTAAPLSVQIHPYDDDPELAQDESGKPEAWYVIHAEPGAGIYLGFRDGVGEDDVRDAAKPGADLSSLLEFVPTEVGDFFSIAPGTPHAIGPGLTLVEPQRVLPGKRGVTYRYWDWNRTYDEHGNEDPTGRPRELHLERALAVSDWDRDWGAWLAKSHQRRGRPDRSGPAQLELLCTDTLGVARLAGTGPISLGPAAWLRGVTVVQGEIEIRTEGGTTEVTRGESAVLPARLEQAELSLDAAHALLCWIPNPNSP